MGIAAGISQYRDSIIRIRHIRQVRGRKIFHIIQRQRFPFFHIEVYIAEDYILGFEKRGRQSSGNGGVLVPHMRDLNRGDALE